MNVIDRSPVPSGADSLGQQEFYGNGTGGTLSISSLVALARRRIATILATFALTLLAALVFAFTATPRYTASTDLLIDSGKTQLLKSQAVLNDGLVDTSMVDSQVEILKSERIALNVIRDLKLQDDSEFGARTSVVGAFIGAIVGLFDSTSISAEESAFRRERASVAIFQSRMKVQRQGRSYVLQIAFSSEHPDNAARIANAIADAYILDLLESKYEITKRASSWLQDRITELGRQATDADGRMQKFKTENNIVETGRGLMNEQQLAEVNSQLIAARAGTAEAKARYERMSDVMASDIPDATVTDALKNDVIIRLRGQYLDLAKREADWSAKYGANHMAAVNLRTEMTNIRTNVRNELQRIAESYRSDYEIAKAREDSLTRDLQGLVTQTGVTNQAQIQLKDLESNAQTSRMLYTNFLQRFMEATQQQSFPITDTRVITLASRPLGPSYPPKLIILGGAFILGIVAAAGMAFLREQLDNVFRTGAQVEDILGIESLGVLARLPTPEAKTGESDTSLPAIPGDRVLSDRDPLLRHVITEPFSRFTETIRSTKVAADIASIGRKIRVIGVVSALPGEGKTLVAVNLAQLIAHSGGRCVLIDGDMRNPSATRHLAPAAKEGLLEVVKGERTIQDVAWRDPETSLRFIPVFIEKNISHTNEVLTSPGMEKLLRDLTQEADYVVIDLPPMVPVIDAKAAAPLIDGFVFIAEWGKTSQDVIKDTLASAQTLRSKVLGLILNKANLSTMKRFENYNSNYYYYKYQSRYGQDNDT